MNPWRNISLWMDQLDEPLAPRPRLQAERHADVAIIGAGYTGLWTAYYLKRQAPQLRIVVLEAETAGFGASGRNGGQVLPGWAADSSTIAAASNTGTAQSLWQLSVDAVDLIDTRIRQHQIDCDWQRGYATVAIKPRHLQELRQARQEAESIYGYHGQQEWSREQLQAQLGSTRYIGALYDPHAGHLHPLNYTLGLARAATAAAGRG